MGASDIATGATVHALRHPLGALHGVAGAACRPRKRRSVHRVEDCDGVIVRWTVWWAYLGWRGGLGGAIMRGTVWYGVTVYWRHGGMRGGTGVRMVGVRGIRGGTGEPYCGDNAGSHGGTGVSP